MPSSAEHIDVPTSGLFPGRSVRFAGPVASVAALETAVQRTFPSTAPAVLKAYRATDAASAARAAADIGRDSSVGAQMANWARAQAKYSRAPAYAYFFARRQPYAPAITFIDHDPATAGAHRPRFPILAHARVLTCSPDAHLEDVDVISTGLTACCLVRARRQASPPRPGGPVFDLPARVVLSRGDVVVDWPNLSRCRSCCPRCRCGNRRRRESRARLKDSGRARQSGCVALAVSFERNVPTRRRVPAVPVRPRCRRLRTLSLHHRRTSARKSAPVATTVDTMIPRGAHLRTRSPSS